MRRRYTNCLLMMAYFASQLAAVPHAHAGTGAVQLPGHDARPHLHLPWLDHSGNSHSHGHTHHHETDESHTPPSGSNSVPGEDGHDKDAVYLPQETGAPSLMAKSAVSVDGSQLVSMLDIAAAPLLSAVFDDLADTCFPGESRPGSPLYLALRALRI